MSCFKPCGGIDCLRVEQRGGGGDGGGGDEGDHWPDVEQQL